MLKERPPKSIIGLVGCPETEQIEEFCPFCKGCDLHIFSEHYDDTNATYYRVRCLDCGTEGPLVGNLTPRQAVKSWDERRLVDGDIESRLHGAIVAAHKKHGCSSEDCPVCEIGSVLPPVNAGVS